MSQNYVAACFERRVRADVSTVSEALSRSICTYAATGMEFSLQVRRWSPLAHADLSQDYYKCKTCEMKEDEGVYASSVVF